MSHNGQNASCVWNKERQSSSDFNITSSERRWISSRFQEVLREDDVNSHTSDFVVFNKTTFKWGKDLVISVSFMLVLINTKTALVRGTFGLPGCENSLMLLCIPLHDNILYIFMNLSLKEDSSILQFPSKQLLQTSFINNHKHVRPLINCSSHGSGAQLKSPQSILQMSDPQWMCVWRFWPYCFVVVWEAALESFTSCAWQTGDKCVGRHEKKN